MTLEVQNGFFCYPRQPDILKGVNLILRPGKILAILGPNGIGKTTLLKCIVGLLKWKSGRSLVDGRDIGTFSPREIWSRISYVPQSHSFAFSFTGLEMVIMGRSAHMGTFEQPGKRELCMAMEVMERAGIERLAHKDCNRMSGGELQMILIAKALVNNPELMILDEPETGLDFHNQILVLDMIEKLSHKENICAVMNTHYPTNALSISDEAFMLDNSGGFMYGPTGEVLNEENISRSFEVRVAVNEFQFGEKTVKSIVPVALA